MERKINRIKLFINNDNKSRKVASQLEEELKKYKFEICNDNYDLGISIGGDGSFLRMVKATNFNNKVYYIGVNSGTLGFLQEINIQDTKDFVKRLNSNSYKVDDISIQETKITTDKNTYHFHSLNEIVVRSKYFNTLKIPVYVDNELLENFTGDGLLISTSTGSTAYNMSFGGSIVYNTLKTLSITPIAPMNNKAYNSLLVPVIVPDDKVISMVTKSDCNDLFFMIDGVNKEIDKVKQIETKIGKKTIKCLRMNSYHFIKIVNDKLLEK